MVHRASIEYGAADANSRLLINEMETTPLEDDLLLLAIKSVEGTNTIIYFIATVSNATNPLDAMHGPLDTLHGTADTPITLTNTEFIRKQAKKAYFRTMESQLLHPHTKIHVEHYDLLVRRSTINNAIQIVVPTPLRQRTLTLAQYLDGRTPQATQKV